MMPGTPTKKLISSFLESLAAEKGYSENTTRGYRNDLQEFFNYLTESRFAGTRPSRSSDLTLIHRLDNITIRGYLGYLHKRNKSKSERVG